MIFVFHVKYAPRFFAEAFRGAVAAVVMLLAVTTFAAPSDVVIVASGSEGQGRTRRTGTIVNYTSVGVRLETAAGRRMTIPADKVVRIETPLCEAHRAGNEAMKARRYDEAIEHYGRAIRDREESRSWMRRRILASVITCEYARGRYDAATQYYVGLLHDDRKSLQFNAIPLAWLPSQRLTGKRAETWLSDELPAVRLLAASYLLATPFAEAAATTLEQLLEDEDARIRELARAQLWRTRIATVSADEVARWPEVIDRLPEPLRVGPYLYLGRALARLGEHQQAALAFMRPPILLPDQAPIVAEALLGAGKSLARAGQAADAARVLRDLIEDFPSTAAAAEARQNLQALQKDS